MVIFVFHDGTSNLKLTCTVEIYTSCHTLRIACHSLCYTASVSVSTSVAYLCAAPHSTMQYSCFTSVCCFCHATCYMLLAMHILYSLAPHAIAVVVHQGHTLQSVTSYILLVIFCCTLHHMLYVLAHCLLSPCSHLIHHISPSFFILISGMLEQVHWPSMTT